MLTTNMGRSWSSVLFVLMLLLAVAEKRDKAEDDKGHVDEY